MICCEVERKSPYCPICGKRLKQDHILYGLLKAARRTQRQTETCLKTLESYGDNKTTYDEKRIVCCTRTAAKWKAWADALEELLSEKIEEQP